MPRSTAPSVPTNFDYGSLYLKRVLLPFWVVRHIFLAIYAVVYIVALVAIASVNDLDNRGRALAICVVLLIIVLATSAAELYTIFMFVRRKLKPLVFLVINSVETIAWGILFGLSVSGLTRRKKRPTYVDPETGYTYPDSNSSSLSGISYLIGILGLLSFVGLFIYAVVVYVRWRKAASRGEYVAPGANTTPGALHATEAPEAYETPMQAQYTGGTVTEFYSPNLSKNDPAGSAAPAGGQPYQSRDFTAAARGLSLDYPGGYYAPAAGNSRSKLPDMEAIELSAQPERRNAR